jgi:WD40 repeat protein
MLSCRNTIIESHCWIRPRLWAVALAVCLSAGAAAQGPARDARGDRLPKGALARLGTTRLLHGTHIRKIAFAGPDRLATLAGSSSKTFTLRLWDARTGARLRTIDNIDGFARSLAITAAGDRAAIGIHTGQVKLFDLSSGKLLRTLKGKGGSFNSLEFTSDGRRLMGVSIRGVMVWEPATGRQIAAIDQKSYRGSIRPDGKQLAVATYHYGKDKKKGAILVFQVETGKQVHQIPRSGSSHWGWVGYSSDGKYLVGSAPGSGKKIRVFRATDFKPVGDLKGADTHIHGLALAPDRNLVAVAQSDRTVRLWDIQTGKQVRNFGACPSRSVVVAFSPDGKLVAAGGGYGMARIWQRQTGKELGPERNHLGPLRAVEVCPDGRRAISIDIAGRAVLWDLKENQPLRRLADGNVSCEIAQFTPDGERALLLDAAGKGGLFDLDSGKKLHALDISSYPAGAGFFHHGSMLYTLTISGKLDIYRTEGLKRINSGKIDWKGPSRRSFSRQTAAVSADMRWSAWAFSRTLALARIDSKQKTFYPIDQPQSYYSFGYALRQATQFGPDSDLLALCSRNGIDLIEIDSLLPVDRFDRPGNAMFTAVQFSPSGRILAAGLNDGRIRLYDLATGRMLVQLAGHADPEMGKAGSSRGRSLQPSRFSAVNYLSFDAQADRLYSAASDSTVLVWDLPALVRLERIAPDADRADALFTQLGSDRPGEAYRARWQLARLAGGAKSLAGKIQPASPVDPDAVRAWIGQLSDASYRRRVQAHRRLGQLGHQAVPLLQRALQDGPPEEVEQRIRHLLADSEKVAVESLGLLQQIRAVRALEKMGTPEARDLLESLAGGTEGARLTVEARAALQRLDS